MVDALLHAWVAGPIVANLTVGDDVAVLSVALVGAGVACRAGLNMWMRVGPVVGDASVLVAVMAATSFVSTALVVSGVVLIVLGAAG